MLHSYRYKTQLGILLIIQVSEQKFHMRVQVLDAMLVLLVAAILGSIGSWETTPISKTKNKNENKNKNKNKN